MKPRGILQGLVYLVSALFLGFFTLRAILAGVWGAPVSPIQHVAFWGAVILALAAAVSLIVPRAGRIVALVGLAALGTWWLPVTTSMVPRNGGNPRIALYVLSTVAVYYATVAFALLRPTRWKWSVPLLSAVIGLGVAAVAVTGVIAARAGEFAWPMIVAYRWMPGEQPLTVVNDREGQLDPDVIAVLQQAGLQGTLEWRHRSGKRNAPHKVIVLAAGQVPLPQRLHFPRDGTIVYAFDGTSWRTIPEQKATYPSYAQIQPDGNRTTIRNGPAGKGSGSMVFSW